MQAVNRILEPFLEQRPRWVLFVPVAIGLGVGLYFAVREEPSCSLVFTLLAVAGLALPFFFRRKAVSRYWLLGVALAALGFSAGCWRALQVDSPGLEKKLGPVTVEGRVMDVNRLEDGAFRLVLDDLEIERLDKAQTPERVRVSVRLESARPDHGDRISLLAVLQPVSLPVEPGAFDFRRHAWFSRIGATGYALSAPQPVARNEKGLSFEGFRQKATDAIHEAVGYMLVAGSPVPAQRSVLMLSVVMLAVILDREPFSLRLAAFAATCILLLAPEALPGPSFQMSFAAVVALIAFYEEFAPGLGNWARGGGWQRRVALYLFGSMATTVVASLATAPFSLYHFQQVALWASIVANMIAVPLTVFVIMPAGFVGLVLTPLDAGGPFFALAGFGNRLVLELASALAAGPFNMLLVPAWPVEGFVLLVAGMLWAVIWRGKLRLGGLVFILAGSLLIAGAQRPDILVSGEGRLAAVRGDGGQLVFSNGRRETFVRREWMRRDGQPVEGKAVLWPGANEAARDKLTCDADACLYRNKGRTISFVRARGALAEDCAVADVVIAMDLSVKQRDCPAPIVIDRWDLRDRGAHAVYMGDDGSITVRNVTTERGNRPWAGDSAGMYPGLDPVSNAGTGFSGAPEP